MSRMILKKLATKFYAWAFKLRPSDKNNKNYKTEKGDKTDKNGKS